MMHPRVSVEFTDVGVTYANGVVALAALSLSIAPNQAVCVVGPSGCGKTTLLRLLAGLERPSQGQVHIAQSMRMAMVFQQGLLFPWLSVADNISYGLMTQGATPTQCRSAAREWCERMGLQRFIDVYPHQLSGGMQQRVGLARALAVNPDLLLLDEPFAALDAQTRLLMQELLCDLRRQGMCRSLLFVTHAIDEALLVGDRVVVLSARPGRILADLSPEFDRQVSLDTIRTQPVFTQTFHQIWQLIRTEVVAQMHEGVS
ncbi:MAG: ABC transporter ATP-binding protein [Roseiflexaceae bacterium]|jgi:NitT/TauT family transport system ATP-binding protein|nr:ABC transporter ATP-binding protein [Chloroflexaceae bacterium]MCE2852397.1 ABC transporter ATP-binding protein [Chloroflexaceae bacterium]